MGAAGPPPIVAPIFVFGDDLTSFDSVETATRYIEPWDADDVTEAFDATGRPVLVIGEGVVRTRRTVSGGRTVIAIDRSAEPEPAALATALRRYVERTGAQRFGLAEPELATVPLDLLVRAVHAQTRTA